MRLFFALPFLLVIFSANAADVPLPDLSGVTDNGLKVEIYSELSPLSINQIHSWHVRVLNSDDEVLELEQLSVFGGMPEHDHGLPTQPEVTTRLDNGDYLLEGVRFHMQGHWKLQIELQYSGVVDTAIIDFNLQ
ncbi:MAG: FixH family protein [Gammaproteobacteria bacterium]|nr:FixH family protein [Gammaproteobacteria bacterium]